MRGIQITSRWGGAAGALGVGALLLTVGCGGANSTAGVRAQELAGGPQIGAQPVAAGQLAGSPVIVSCEPHQRALVRPTVVNGTTMSQVECVAADRQAAAYAQQAYGAAAVPADYGYVPPVSDARVVPVRTYRAAPVRTRQVVYRDPVTVRKGRSVKKSAIIIGSSAGVGAGVGAAVGGKKGALIGAAIGGGSAAIWDQITRR
jgi:hypothetical protein